MSLQYELGLRKPITLVPHEALLNIYFAATRIKKRAGEFLRPFGLTDVQLNVLMLLYHQSGANGGLSQAQISDMMLVNQANITSLIDRMEKAKLVVRTAAANDRRCNIVKLTEKGKKLFAKVDPLYTKEVKKAMAVLREVEQKKLIEMLEKVRANISG
jgi:MarR family 2-MHQ and catechol resistance regulon transcriptional repressor